MNYYILFLIHNFLIEFMIYGSKIATMDSCSLVGNHLDISKTVRGTGTA